MVVGQEQGQEQVIDLDQAVVLAWCVLVLVRLLLLLCVSCVCTWAYDVPPHRPALPGKIYISTGCGCGSIGWSAGNEQC